MPPIYFSYGFAVLIKLSGASSFIRIFFFPPLSLGGECQPRVQPAVSGPLRCGQTERRGTTHHQENYQRYLEGAQPQKHSRNRYVNCASQFYQPMTDCLTSHISHLLMFYISLAVGMQFVWQQTVI